jgi:hypothetical protein
MAEVADGADHYAHLDGEAADQNGARRLARRNAMALWVLASMASWAAMYLVVFRVLGL